MEWFNLVNRSRKEYINYHHLGANSWRELSGSIAAAAITTWYMIKYRHDDVFFVSDYEDEEAQAETNTFREVTDEVINELIEERVLKEEERHVFDPEDADGYYRRFRNIWDK